MFDKIKFLYILKIKLSVINDKTKLKLIKYNKNLQHKLNINITLYKIIIVKYIIYENKRKEKGQKKEKNMIIYLRN